jgi:hypothetical protein
MHYEQKKNINIFIVTRLEKSGGHTRLIKDYIEAFPKISFLILVTDKIPHKDYRFVSELFGNKKNVLLEISRDLDRDKKLIWLQKKIITTSPNKILLFTHNQDSPAISAMQPEMNIPVYFFHHADHLLSLGLFLKHVIHVDLHKHIYNFCNTSLGINNTYVPMFCRDRGVRKHQFMKDGYLISATAGGKNKIEKPYFLDYAFLIPLMLKKNNGKHIHIGKLSIFTLLKIKFNLIKFNIKQDNFIYIPWVPSVWEELKSRHVDLYINSFPAGGGLSLVEAMGLGIPVAIHSHEDSKFYSSGSLGIAYPKVFQWSQPNELIKFCLSLDSSSLEHLSKISRSHYLKNFNSKDIQSKLNCQNFQTRKIRSILVSSLEEKLLTDYFQRNWFEKFSFKLRQRMAYIKHIFNF